MLICGDGGGTCVFVQSLTRLSELPRLRDLDLSNNAFWSKIRDLNRALTEQEENHFMSYFFESRLKVPQCSLFSVSPLVCIVVV